MEKREIEFKSEVIFNGSIEQFQRFAEELVKLDGKIDVGRCWRPWKRAGSITFPMKFLLKTDDLMNLVKAEKKFKLIKDINGGIRNPHFHLENEIVLFDQPAFEKFTEKVAERMTR